MIIFLFTVSFPRAVNVQRRRLDLAICSATVDMLPHWGNCTVFSHSSHWDSSLTYRRLTEQDTRPGRVSNVQTAAGSRKISPGARQQSVKAPRLRETGGRTWEGVISVAGR